MSPIDKINMPVFILLITLDVPWEKDGHRVCDTIVYKNVMRWRSESSYRFKTFTS